MLYVLRNPVKKFLLTCARAIDFSFLSPNKLTLLAIPLAIVTAFFIYNNELLFAAVFLAITFFVDALDGALAKLRRQETGFGNYLDSVVDRVVEAIIFFGFVFSFPFPAVLGIALSLLVSYSKPRLGKEIETDNRDWPSIGDKPDRNVLLFIGMLYSAFFPFTGYQTMELVLYLIIVLTFVGNIQRILIAKKMVKDREKSNKK